MGAQHSTRSHNLAVADAGAGGGDGHGHLPCLAELMSYEEACRLDPELETFDSTLQQRTGRAISTLTDGVQVRSLSLDSLREITGCLLEMNQEVVKVILDCKRDVWKNTELFDLVEEYFQNSLQTLDFCTTLEKCLTKARDNQLILRVALQRFAEEEEEDNKGDNARYSRTLKELRRFKAAGDPFTEEFFKAFRSIHHQQLQMLDKMRMRKNKLDKKLKSIKAWRKVSSIIFAATLTTFLICSIVVAAIAAPPVAAAVAAAAAIPIGSMGKWLDSLLKDYQNALKGQKEVLLSMQVGTCISIRDMDNIHCLIDQLEIQMASLLSCMDFAIRDVEAMKIVMEKIGEKMEVFMKSVENLARQADRCSTDITRARTVLLQKIINTS
ncbi:UPF0496 protein 1-like [Zingiber officinale]|uniref:Uncharacterized protein n=1 Tax=Zingiber officinale TaxID=94328 RepID=A0A8J5LXL7_ZINOF|nr:UPF0496 protein 1-like [Zingiber officinale]KAG6535051.1 hypothetical protein ZIOFF_000005 [Zingiber officinale]